MHSSFYPSTSAFDELPLAADQRAQLKAFVSTLRQLDGQAASAAASAHRASAAAELMLDHKPLGEAPSPSAGLPVAGAPAGGRSSTRAMVLLIASEATLGQRIAATIAQELSRELLPVEISRVVSKFIAETEKHLEELFDIAGEDGNILFFDEADALFGRDGQASGSHFADQEVGYLLHHIEGFNGVSVLSIHAGTPVDEEVIRRFTCVIRA